ncbi:MAG: methyltransferase domain-containing protein [Chloroflexota bacterium]
MSWKFFHITHKYHTILNPSSSEKLDRLVSLLKLEPDANVLEIAAGKGELITRIIERYGVSGVAVDLSPDHSRDARATFAQRIPHANLTFLEMDGAEYRPDEPESFDLTLCLGASWIWNGHRGTLAALKTMTKPGGLIAVGEPFWLQEPDPEFLKRGGYERDTFASHYQNFLTGQELGLNLLYTIVSDHYEWDNYYSLYWYAGDEYIRTHPDDPDLPEFKAWLEDGRDQYLRWERDTLGWAIYLFRK